jgi:peptidoglycan hydrolase-like protein with peptidoglycan-binding domain
MFFISLIRLFTILLYVDAAVLDFSNMPSSICGYPSLHTTGRFPEWNTRLAQYLLGFSLNDTNYSIDGIFSSETTADIESFQKLYGLEVNGYLNIDTWPSLLSTVTPLNIGSQGTPVMALQDVLTANGYVIEITGEYDQFTADVLAKFQLERGASISTGNEVDEQTWHLLTTQCNSTTSDYYWFDAGKLF